jgi:glycosyltransferase involved in cell wall biosynthesis
LNILIIHEVSYLSKIIYEFQILPEILSLLGHRITIIDYDDTWQSSNGSDSHLLRTRVHRNIHRAYEDASVTVRRPGIIRLPVISRISGALTGGVEIYRVLKSEKPDIVLLYGLPTVGLQTLLAARRFKTPIVFRAIDVTHQLVPYPVLIPVTKVLEKIIFASVDFNIALTPHLKQYIAAYGIPQDRIRLLPSGVDTRLFSPGPRSERLLSRWGIEATDPVIFFMGTIYEFSGLDRVIRDFPLVLRHHPAAKLLIAGKGKDEVRLLQLAQQVGVSRNVIFTGMLPYAALPDMIRSADVCINPFELNGVTKDILPTKLFQYMACAKPVLATPLPGTLAFLEGVQHGVMYASLSDFNLRMSELISNEPLQRNLAQNGHETSLQYDWFEIAKTLVSWLASAG